MHWPSVALPSHLLICVPLRGTHAYLYLCKLQVYDVEVDCKQMPSREQLRDELVSTLPAVVCKPAGTKFNFLSSL